MNNVFDDKHYRVEETRRTWGSVFNNFRSACERWNSAWYFVDDRQAWKEEEKRRLQAIIEQAQKAIDALEARR